MKYSCVMETRVNLTLPSCGPTALLQKMEVGKIIQNLIPCSQKLSRILLCQISNEVKFEVKMCPVWMQGSNLTL